MQMTLQINTQIRFCINNFLDFRFAKEAFVPAHHLMLNAGPDTRDINKSK